MLENGCSNGAESLLSDDEQSAIKESWSFVWKDKKENGIKLFIKLFTKYPEAQQKFKDFRGISMEEIKVHKKLRAHALSVVYALKSFIDNLDDVETLAELVKKIARSHVERTVTEKEITWLVPVFIEVLEDIMADQIMEVHKNSWTKLFEIIRSLWQEEQEQVIQALL